MWIPPLHTHTNVDPSFLPPSTASFLTVTSQQDFVPQRNHVKLPQPPNTHPTIRLTQTNRVLIDPHNFPSPPPPQGKKIKIDSREGMIHVGALNK